MPSFRKTNPLARETFADFERAFDAKDRRAVSNDAVVYFDKLPAQRDSCEKILAQLSYLDAKYLRGVKAKFTSVAIQKLFLLTAKVSATKSALSRDDDKLKTGSGNDTIFAGDCRLRYVIINFFLPSAELEFP